MECKTVPRGWLGSPTHQWQSATLDRSPTSHAGCLESFEKNKCIHTAMKDVVDDCTHTNEIVFTSFMMAKIIDTNEQRNRLHDMLKEMSNRGF